jgi:uncharacterized protein with von Willebrand factor type A (vWA) domain
MARPSKEELEKRKEHKKQFDELFGDIFKRIDEKKASQAMETIEEFAASKNDASNNKMSSSDDSWLKDEIKAISEDNKRLESELVKAKEDYAKLLSSKSAVASADDSDVINNVRLMYNDLLMNFEGRNNERTRYSQANIGVLLSRMKKLFPFL